MGRPPPPAEGASVGASVWPSVGSLPVAPERTPPEAPPVTGANSPPGTPVATRGSTEPAVGSASAGGRVGALPLPVAGASVGALPAGGGLAPPEAPPRVDAPESVEGGAVREPAGAAGAAGVARAIWPPRSTARLMVMRAVCPAGEAATTPKSYWPGLVGVPDSRAPPSGASPSVRPEGSVPSGAKTRSVGSPS